MELQLAEMVNEDVLAERDEVTSKLSTLLYRHKLLPIIYTHHPTTLYYTFSIDRFPPTLQNQVVSVV